MGNDIAIDIKNVTVRFNKANQKVDNLKEYFVRMVKKQLVFQEHLAVKNVNVQIKKGESWGIIGTNGSGKSTLLKAVSGIIKPFRGKITVNGSVAPLIELGAGFDPSLTARENIYLNGCILGYTDKYMKEQFEKIVEFAEIGDFLDSPVKNFSSGMKARLGFAVATMVKADIVIVDEALSVGDYAFKKKCEQRMNEMLSGGTTLLFVSHSLEEVKRLCQKVIWMDKGTARMIGDAQEVCDAYFQEQKAKVDQNNAAAAKK